MMIEDLAREMGIADVRICSDLDAAASVASHAKLDCAVLDLRVRGGETSRIADILAERGIPFMFSTGGNLDSVPHRHRDRPLINKPFAEDDFKLALLDTVRAERLQPCAPSVRVATLSLTD
jgi:hypothetical protein